MNCGTSSLKKCLVLMCIIQCFVNPVSSLKCHHCLANEKGKCIIPSKKENYVVDCAEYISNFIEKYKQSDQKKLLGQAVETYVTLASNKYSCQTAKAKSMGEVFEIKDCVPKGWTSELTEAMHLGANYDFEGANECATDFCNAANNPYIKLSYLLTTLTFIYIAVY